MVEIADYSQLSRYISCIFTAPFPGELRISVASQIFQQTELTSREMLEASSILLKS